MPARNQGREHRVADYLQRELASLLRAEIQDARVGLVTVNEVRVSRDLGYADVYVSQLVFSPLEPGQLAAETNEQHKALLEVLNAAAGHLRSMVSRDATMRSVPKLRFHYDETIESGMRMDLKIRDAVLTNRNLEPDDSSTDAQEPRS